jgi:hypothetical protein
VHYRLYIKHSLGNGVCVRDISIVNVDHGLVEEPLFSRRMDQAANLVVVRQQFRNHPTAQKSGGPGHQNLHAQALRLSNVEN